MPNADTDSAGRNALDGEVRWITAVEASVASHDWYRLVAGASGLSLVAKPPNTVCQ